MAKITSTIKQRLEYLRGELRAGRMSYGEVVELQSLAAHIHPGDSELLEAAGVSEDVYRSLQSGVLTQIIPPDFAVQPLKPDDDPPGKATCGHCHLSWDDSISTSYTPVPAGRCPFEAYHGIPKIHE
jgi:hypothetical protein